MTKTKKQLRAEAVERLKNMDDWCGNIKVGSDYVKALLWDLRVIDEEHVRDALIDLLTDDDANDDSAPEKVVSGGAVDVTTDRRDNATNQPISESADCETPETAEIGASKCEIRDFDDSREKLEADVRKHYSYTTSTLMYPPSANKQTDWLASMPMDTVFGWLDRQAAITKRECMDTRINFAERVRFGSCIDELTDERDHLRRQVDMLNEQVIELTAQRDEQDDIEFVIPLENVREYVLDPPGYLKKRILEIEKQRDEYRKKLGKALDLACEIVRLGD